MLPLFVPTCSTNIVFYVVNGKLPGALEVNINKIVLEFLHKLVYSLV